MASRERKTRVARLVASAVAAAALAAWGVREWETGAGRAMLLVGILMLAAAVLRFRLYRD